MIAHTIIQFETDSINHNTFDTIITVFASMFKPGDYLKPNIARLDKKTGEPLKKKAPLHDDQKNLVVAKAGRFSAT